jgi:hypothetical protein
MSIVGLPAHIECGLGLFEHSIWGDGPDRWQVGTTAGELMHRELHRGRVGSTHSITQAACKHSQEQHQYMLPVQLIGLAKKQQFTGSLYNDCKGASCTVLFSLSVP